MKSFSIASFKETKPKGLSPQELKIVLIASCLCSHSRNVHEDGTPREEFKLPCHLKRFVMSRTS